jgi:hypothetical protein
MLDPGGQPTGWKQNIFSYPPIGSPDGGAQVTAADLVSFARALRVGRLLSAERTEQFLTPQVLHHQRDDGAVWYGFGLEFVTDRDGAVRNYYKDGANAGASGIVRYYPTEQLDVVVLSDSATGAWPPIDEIHRLIRSGQPQPPRVRHRLQLSRRHSRHRKVHPRPSRLLQSAAAADRRERHCRRRRRQPQTARPKLRNHGCGGPSGDQDLYRPRSCGRARSAVQINGRTRAPAVAHSRR